MDVRVCVVAVVSGVVAVAVQVGRDRHGVAAREEPALVGLGVAQTVVLLDGGAVRRRRRAASYVEALAAVGSLQVVRRAVACADGLPALICLRVSETVKLL